MKALICLTMLLASAMWFSSCRSVQYVPVETIKEKIEYRDRLQRDSIHVKDSIYVRSKGDSVFVDRWHTEYKDRLLRDTTYIQHTDSIQVPYPVERKLSWWESVKLELGEIAIGVILVLLVIIGWLVRRSHNQIEIL